MPVDFESGESWWDALQAKGFDAETPTVVSSTGVSMYLTRDATEATLSQVAAMAPGSVLAMTFMLPPDLVADDERQMQVDVERAARNSGTPFVSHYPPDEMVEMCHRAGFSSVRHVSPADLTELLLQRANRRAAATHCRAADRGQGLSLAKRTARFSSSRRQPRETGRSELSGPPT